MFNTITVIGLGTLGGYLCKHLCENENLKELIIVDFDRVESKNTFKSIYKYDQVGEFKVDALKELLDDDIIITKINEKYKEGKTKIPNSDLVIDCRDIVCSRLSEIDIRLYISNKSLMIDCRKYVDTCNIYKGKYSHNLSKREISKAAYFASQLIFSKQIEDMIKNNLLQIIDLNIVESFMEKAIHNSLNKIDIIYELPNKNNNKIHGLEQNIRPIIALNKKQDVKVVFADRIEELTRIKSCLEINEAKTNYQLIPANTLQSSIDVIQYLNEIIKQQNGVNNFIVMMRSVNGEKCIELIEETGAA